MSRERGSAGKRGRARGEGAGWKTFRQVLEMDEYTISETKWNDLGYSLRKSSVVDCCGA